MANEKILALVVLIVAVMSVGAYIFVNSPASGEPSVSVSGNSEITSMPDFVSIYINIETNSSSAELAKDENANITEKVLLELKKLNFKDSDIQTISWNIYEDFSWSESGRKSEGYKVTNVVKVEMTDYNFAGVVVDKVVDAGAIIQGINFEITKERENELKAQALEAATIEARKKAEAIAAGSGKKVGKIVAINADDSYYYPYPLYEYARGSDAKVATTQISARELTVYGNVQVTFQLK
jgi:uncharacterized protein